MATTVRTLQNFIGGEWAEATGETISRIVVPVASTQSPPTKFANVRTVVAMRG